MRELRNATVVAVLLFISPALLSQPVGWDGNQSLDALHHFMQGNIYLDAGELLPAAEFYQKALQHDPEMEKAWYNLAIVRYQMHDYRRAEACFDTLFSLNPMKQEAYGLYGMTLYHRRAYARAVKAFNFALEATPSEDLFIARAMALIGAGETGRALGDFDQVLSTRPGNMTACMGKGAALMELGSYHQAVTYFNRVLDLDPGNVAALTNRAICRAERGEHREAENDFYEAVLNGGQTDTYLARAKYRFRNGRRSAALNDIRTAMRISPQAAAVYFTLGEMELISGQYHAALESFSIALDLDPLCTACFLHRSEAETLIFQYENAIQDLYSVLDIDPGSSEAREKLLWVYDQMDRKRRQ